MEDKDTNSSINKDSSAHPGLAGQKVIQPSASILEELSPAQANPTERPKDPIPSPTQPSPQNVSQAAPPPAAQPQPTPTSSLYPEATKGFGLFPPAPEPVASSDEPSLVDTKLKSKILAVRIVAIALIALNAINAYNWYLEKRAGYTGWTTIVGAGIGFILALGILKLSETARSVYVFVSVVLLILTGIGFITFYASYHSIANHSNITPVTKQGYENALQAARKNPSLTPEERQAEERTLQRQINALSGSPVDVKIKQYLSEVLSIAVAVGPLIFFTRPSIKEVFTGPDLTA